MGKGYYTREEAARLWPVSYPLIEEKIGKGELPEVYEEGQRLIPAEVLNAFILGLPIPKISKPAESAVSSEPDGWSQGLSLYPWQQEALDWWREHKYQGVIEAVTGTGKTRLALAAAEYQLRHGGRVVVVIPMH